MQSCRKCCGPAHKLLENINTCIWYRSRHIKTLWYNRLSVLSSIAELQWLGNLLNHGNSFEKWAVRATEDKSWSHVKKPMVIIYGSQLIIYTMLVCCVLLESFR